MNEMDYGLTYGLVKEFNNCTQLWYEPITDEIDGFVLRDTRGSIIQIWATVAAPLSLLVDEYGYPVPQK